MNFAKKNLSEALSKLIKDVFDQDITAETISGEISTPPNPGMGHLAFPCFFLSKTLKNAPVKIAQALLDKTVGESFPYIGSFKLAGPYLNVFLKTSNIAEELLPKITNGEYFKKKLVENGPKTMVEYSQPNTHKELHVGHMRNLALGDAIVRILKYTGTEVLGVTYPGDVGTHVAKCIWYLKYHNKEPQPQERKGAWLGGIYAKATALLLERVGTDDDEGDRKIITKILKALEKGKGEYHDLWLETRKWSIDMMKDVYKWADVSFDKWYWESEVDSASLNRIKQFHEDGKLIKDDGAIGMDLTDDDLGFCLLLKSDGNGLYATKDIELAIEKFKEDGIKKSIYVVDKRQAHHFKQVFKVLEKLGFEEAKQCHHLEYDFVELPDGAMSSRKGNIIPIQELIDEMVNLIKNEHLHKYKEVWKEDEIDLIANQVAQGAIKYGMIRIDNNRKIVFNMKEWLKLDGESGPYIQYVHARISSLLMKFNLDTKEANYSLLSTKSEKNLILKLLEFNETVLFAANNLKTSGLTSYLYELSRLFNSFYAECPIGKVEDSALKNARLHLAGSCAEVLKQGLALLGIPAPSKM